MPVDPITFCRVCGVTITCAADSVARKLERVDDSSVSMVNRPINRRRGLRLTVEASTTPTSRTRLAALDGLIRGHAHAWTYDVDFHSSRGKGPEAGLTASIVVSPTPKVGAGCADISEITYDLDVSDDGVELADRWCWHGWVHDGAAWQDVQVRSDGAVWVDGVRDDTFDTTWLVIGFGSMSLTGVVVDDVALFLFEPDDDMIDELHAWHVDNAWAAFGRLVVDGDLVEGRTFDALGDVDEGPVVQFSDGGTWENAGGVLRFRLQQQEKSALAPLLSPPLFLVYTNPANFLEDAAGYITAPALVRNGVLGSRTGPIGEPAAVFDGSQWIGLTGGVFARYDLDVVDPLSFSAWVYLTGAGGIGVIVGKGDVGVDTLPAFFVDGDLLGFAWWKVGGPGTGLDVRSSVSLDHDRWVHVVARYDGSNDAGGIELLADMVALPVTVVSNSALTPPAATTTTPAIASTHASAAELNFAVGALDQVAMFGVRLTDAEVAELYRAGQRKRRIRFHPPGV